MLSYLIFDFLRIYQRVKDVKKKRGCRQPFSALPLDLRGAKPLSKNNMAVLDSWTA
jgi:hypothetical protein